MPKNDALIQALRDALAATPDAVVLRVHLAELLLESGDAVEAAHEYRRALDLEPDNAAIKLALARAYVQQEKATVALVILDELRKTGGLSPAALILAARAYLQTGEPVQAADAYTRAIDQDPALADPDMQRQLAPLEPEPGAAPPTATAPAPPQATATEDAEPGDDGGDEPLFVTVPPAAGDAADLIERPALTFEDVGGMQELKEEVRLKIIYPLTHPDIYQAYGKQIGGGILMYGPPGCGKTYLARATAGEVNAHFIAVGLHDVLDMYIGQSEKRLHAVFELARSNTPCVLFFDEVDALGASRSDMRHSPARRVINQFLAELDGIFTANEGLLILAATNAPWHLDPALRRPGRFDRVLFVPPPDPAARAAILRLHLAGKPCDNIDYHRLARKTGNFSGADLRGLVDVTVEQKLREAMQSGVPQPLTTRDLLRVAKSVHPTTQEWFATARNYAIYANQGGIYNDILDYLKLPHTGFHDGGA